MRIVTPRPIGEDEYASGNLTEDQYSEWASGMSYTRGNFATVLSVHTVYQCLRDHTSDADNSPTAEAAVFADPLQEDPDTPNWIRVGATNKWRLFDTRPSQRATRASEITVNLRAPAAPSDTLAFMNLRDCSEIGIIIFSGATRARVAWTEPLDGMQAIRRYEYRFSTDGGTTWSAWTTVPDSDETTTFFDLEDMDPGTTDYDIEVRAVNPTGDGDAAEETLTSTTYQPDDSLPAEDTGTRLASQPRGGTATVPDAPDDLTFEQARVELDNQDNSLVDASNVFDWLSYFFANSRLFDQYVASYPLSFNDKDLSDAIGQALVNLTIIATTGDAILITLTGGDALGCGQIILGSAEIVGEAVSENSGIETLDFSHAETNIYGDLTTVERPTVEVYNFTVHTDVEDAIRMVSAVRSQKGGKLAVWIADDKPGVRAWQYGFLRDYRSTYQSGTYLRSQLQVQGVA